jgi:hypothetical protein
MISAEQRHRLDVLRNVEARALFGLYREERHAWAVERRLELRLRLLDAKQHEVQKMLEHELAVERGQT